MLLPCLEHSYNMVLISYTVFFAFGPHRNLIFFSITFAANRPLCFQGFLLPSAVYLRPSTSFVPFSTFKGQANCSIGKHPAYMQIPPTRQATTRSTATIIAPPSIELCMVLPVKVLRVHVSRLAHQPLNIINVNVPSSDRYIPSLDNHMWPRRRTARPLKLHDDNCVLL